ncbi:MULTISPECIES: riboflavin synthase subunit alpha [unclassified Pseudoalteromonas]|uniref:riboflavin synthase subunit alpha n=1 Tax=unclassified Pseudoalteromonas TaxID=194690 RepID=UPI0025B290D7|nr:MULTISPECIES: riboflavin synthase subunit alpha [unclassified Pseudoalteromonas]MDN3377724.1 riboflavin synthase subunit alpha [Pseudoalteromonas sp. APC 3893]MDN3385920.1 riboflavin synthase subunit alpha [Pseudoalteromonas sp. APC 4017]
MFTGIVQTKATVLSTEQREGVLRLTLSVGIQYIDKLEIGASIAINGCCLTVVKFSPAENQLAHVYFDVIDETLKLTNLGQLAADGKVNFERSMIFGSELGGHIMSGHIHCTARIDDIINTQDNCKIRLALTSQWQKFVLYKGFVGVNGASLTVGETDDNGFWLHLIPETLAITNLGLAKVGEQLNIEVDQQTFTIINTVENYLKQSR